MKDLIDNLVDDLKPVKKLWLPHQRAAAFFIIDLIVVFSLMWMIHPFRSGWWQDLLNPAFVIQIALFVISIITFSYFSLASVVPGAIKNKNLIWSITPFILLILTLLFSLSFPAKEISMIGKRAFCDVEIILISLIPFFHLVFLLRKGFMSSKGATIVMATSGAALLPAGMMHFACMYDPKHILLFHMGPVIFAVALFSGLYIFFTKKN